MQIIAAWFAIGIIASILEIEILAMAIMISLILTDTAITPNIVALTIALLLAIGLIKSFIRQASY